MSQTREALTDEQIADLVEAAIGRRLLVLGTPELVAVALRDLQQRRALVPAPDAQVVLAAHAAGFDRGWRDGGGGSDYLRDADRTAYLASLAAAVLALPAPPVACETGEGETR